jgi:hypothetical protein
MALALFFLLSLLCRLVTCAPLPLTTNVPITTSEDNGGFNPSEVAALVVAIVGALLTAIGVWLNAIGMVDGWKFWRLRRVHLLRQLFTVLRF